MAAVEQNITLDEMWFAGTDKAIVFTFTGVDITLYSLSFALQRRGTNMFSPKTTASGIAILSSTVCSVSTTDDESALVLPGVLYRYELKRTNAGLEEVCFFGSAILRKSLH
jgi:hypothetical protein